MIKLAVVTTTRAEYGLLHPLIEQMLSESEFQVHVLVSGTHLLEKYGNTIQYIREDRVPIAYEIPIYTETFMSNEIETTAAIGKAAEQCSTIFTTEKYNGIIVLGDRYELLGFCIAAVMCRIPIVHIHGGELTEGAIDDKIRHAITKLASIHFPAISEYARRIIQMGENPQNVFAVGALGIDNIKNLSLIDKKNLYNELNIREDYQVAVVTFHPVTTEDVDCALKEVRNLFDALLEVGIFAVVTMPNSDVGSDVILEEIKKYVEQYPKQFIFIKSLGQKRYLSLLQSADVMVGNSSSGILESASFTLPTVDIGSRQKGRMQPRNVIHCECEMNKIVQSIRRGLSKEFKDSLDGYVNPYGDGHTAKRIVDIMKNIDYSNPELVCKKFYDVGKVNE